MGLHSLHRRQIVPASIATCWAFFSDPRNLVHITPPALGFRVISELPPTITPGLTIRYRVRPLFGIPLTWVSEITQVEPLHSFVDEQKAGPYASWRHKHTFRALAGAHTEIEDSVTYQPPFGWVGEMFHPFLIAPRLEEIFSFREAAVFQRFGPAQASRG